MSFDAHTSNGTLRRTRSTGDIPRQPELSHRPRGSRHSDSHSDLCDPQLGHQDRMVGSSPASQALPDTGITSSGRYSPPSDIITYSEQGRPQIVGRNLRPLHQESPDIDLTPQPHMSSYERTLAFFGIGRSASRARRSLVGLFFNLTSGFVQIVIIVTVLALSGTHLKSPTQPELTEWVACNRPLGIWACIWVVRAILACGLTYWSFLRERLSRQRHTEEGRTSGSTIGANSSSPRTTMNATTDSTLPHQTYNHQTASPQTSDHPPLPYTRLYSRLTLLSSLLTLSWFLTAHILEYTSINTCRRSSPHIWWLTFGILCLMYLMVLEVVLLGFVVFIVAPVLFLFWNIFLVCIGRHPLQTTSVIKPEIGKLSKSLVDRIPLVMYIPPPPADAAQEKLAIPEPALTYPPKPAVVLPPPPKTRFKFIRSLSSFKGKKINNSDNPKERIEESIREPQTWEQHWEQGEYPFVVLEGNRAACAICLMDFEEPKKIKGSPTNEEESSALIKVSTSGPLEIERNKQSDHPHPNNLRGDIDEEDREENLKLEDAGDGAQPLRLLACGHVFHKTCLDPWLTDVSGRCPVCQRAVEIPEVKKMKKGRR
ncbi:hypothetical protein BDZ94DRAFT_1265294 [Collybia nuda]|uniref:RING-type E3 ubiquitin transferase n=1 Tax=Collybia nuda TaxID=64659 RepID=A0A9P6CCI4_9AGAR|nr:hypothetical protein BDZ94DRAFT_1265294 [Collybia nuda]